MEALMLLKSAGATLEVRSDKGLIPLKQVEMLEEVSAPVVKGDQKAVQEYHDRIETLRKLLEPGTQPRV
jgi:hypothetical protein